MYEAFGVVVENHSRIEETLGVEGIFEAFHQVPHLCSPFSLDKRSHIAACAVLGFQRTVETPYDQLFYAGHKVAVFVDVLLGLESLGYYKMIVALERMAIDAGIVVAAFLKKFRKGDCSFW